MTLDWYKQKSFTISHSVNNEIYGHCQSFANKNRPIIEGADFYR